MSTFVYIFRARYIMLSVFWNVVTVLSTAIEWIVLKLVLDEISNQKVNKIKINTMKQLNLTSIKI